MKVRAVLYACREGTHNKFYMIEQIDPAGGCGCTIRYGRIGQLAGGRGFIKNTSTSGLLGLLDKKIRGWRKKPYEYVEVFDRYDEQETHMVAAISWANGDDSYIPVTETVEVIEVPRRTWYNNARVLV